MKSEKVSKFQWRRLAAVIWDILLVNIAYFGSIWIRFDFRYSLIPYELSTHLIKSAPLFTLLALLIYWGFKMYQSLAAYVGFPEIVRSLLANSLFVIAQSIIMRFTFEDAWIPNGFYLIEFFLLFIGITAHRFLYRFQLLMERFLTRTAEEENSIPTLIVGAGEAGRTLIHEMNVSEKVKNHVVALIDDDPSKHGRAIEGVKIYGGRDKIESVVKKLGVREIILALPSSSRQQQKEILEICQRTDAKMKIVPGIYQIITGEVSVSKVRDVSLDDLLGRESIEINTFEVGNYLEGKRVLVTGGGGTIGSELCRQIARFRPQQIIILDVNENGSYDVQMEVKRHHPELDIRILIGSIRDKKRLASIFEEYRPEIVYHAAAHKHVHLMEAAPHESIKNNVIGTRNVAEVADRYGVKRFVLISTDKAVNPTSIYGAGKRICEMIIQEFAARSKTDFVAVRFGNVLGSSGSVIPLFKKEIAEGGPVTVTHPDIVRFFMTIPEAVSLVLQASCFAKGGEIFVLDMGEPVRILDMAKKLIRLSGYRVGEDIEIVFTGLRPGEKLYEEVLMSEEGLRETKNSRIRVAEPLNFDLDRFDQQLDTLEALMADEKTDVRDTVADMVDTFKVPVEGIPIDYKEYQEEGRSALEERVREETHKYDNIPPQA